MELWHRFGSGWAIPLLLAAGVLLPTAGVLWFMNQAARSQEQAARQSVEEAYRGQLRLLRDRLDVAWQARMAALERAAGDGSPANFPSALEASGADTVLFLAQDGTIRFPVPLTRPNADDLATSSDWDRAEDSERHGDRTAAAAAYEKIAVESKSADVAARAARAAIRCLVQAGRNEEALTAVARYFERGRTGRGVDVDGRWIAADEGLLALRLLKPADRRFTAAAQRLAVMLNRYDGVPMPSSQRVFLMQELRTAAPAMPLPAWFGAERLALSFLETDRARAGQPLLAATDTADLWMLTTPNRRAIALFRTGTVIGAGQRLLAEQNSSRSVEFGLSPPGAPSTGESVPAGSILPGWQVSFALRDGNVSQPAARQKMATYVWVGYCMIASVVLAGVMLAQTFRRQSRLARMKTDLVATVSHELKTPLASMRLLVETLLEEENVPAERQREYLEMIAGENQRLSRLIDNFLTFSRIERHKTSFAFRDTDPAKVVESAVRSVRDRVQAPECRLEVEVAPGLPAIRADHDALVTVLLNLLDNAYKYTRGEKHLAVKAYENGGRVVFAVKDNGIGITAREQRLIFRRYYQVDRRLAREAGGCGLGLSIVDFIVRAHGGEVRVESAPGSGSTFSVWLPATEAGA